MSSHAQVYLGPYVECTRRSDTVAVAVRGCLEPSCGRHPEGRVADAVGNFCSGCGGPIGLVHVQVEAFADLDDVVGGALFSLDDGRADVIHMAPNVRRDGDPRIDSGRLLHDVAATLVHEVAEMRGMSGGKRYTAAHAAANVPEREARTLLQGASIRDRREAVAWAMSFLDERGLLGRSGVRPRGQAQAAAKRGSGSVSRA